jgi:hypothetical protein
MRGMPPAEGPSTESKPGMGICWASPEADALQSIQTVGKTLSLAKGFVPVESTTGPYSIYDWCRDNL